MASFEGTDRLPMWIGDKIFFTSDRDRVLNIYSYDTNTGDVEQVTRHKEYDVRRPSDGGGKIVYELGGSLWLLDTATGNSAEVPVEILADSPEVRPYIKSVEDYVTGFDCSPSGKRAVVTARGEVFTVPAKDGPTRNLTQDAGARDKNAVWSPDGKTIAYISDTNGEYNIYTIDSKGAGDAVRLTNFKDGYRHTPRWSPDSKKIAFADQTLRCYYIDVESKKVVEIDKADFENIDVSLDVKPIYDYAWSPDSRFVAYSKMDEDLVFKVYMYSLDTGNIHCVSRGIFNDFNPAFSADGKHLLFVSNRRFDPTLCDFEWEMVYKNVAGVYALTLEKDGAPLLPFESDEEAIEVEEASDKKDEGDEEVKVVIDFEGVEERIEHLPFARGNFRYLNATEKAIFYLNKDQGDFNRFEFRSSGPMDLHRFSLEDREDATVIKAIDGYRLSADGKKIVYRQGNSVGIIDASATDSPGKSLDLSDMKMNFDPLAEWTQIFNEAWRWKGISITTRICTAWTGTR